MAYGDPGSGILDPSNPLSFAFGGGGPPLSLEEIKRRRAVQAALASQKRAYPKNIGEGLTALGEALGERASDDRLSAAEKGYNKGFAADPLINPGAAPAAGKRSEVVDPQRDKITTALLTTPQEVAQGNPTVAGQEAPTTDTLVPSPSAGDPLANARATAISGIESGGRYDAVGVPTKYGRALGKYGVVEANVAPWTKAALGQPLTPQQYLADKDAQDAVFKHRFGQYVDRFGEEGAARAWFGGPGNVNNTNATDAHGRLTIGTYGQDYMRRLQGAQGGAQPSGAPGDGGDVGGVATDDSGNPPTPTTIQPMRVAQAGVPGPLTPPTPVQQLTPEQLQTDPGFAIPSGKPGAPRKQENPTPEETRGLQILMKYPGDERAKALAERLIKFGQDKREADYNRQVEEYKLTYGTHEKEALRRATENSPAERAKLRATLRDEEDKQRLGGITPAVFEKAIEKSYEGVKNISSATSAIQNARHALLDEKMFTGSTAEINLSAKKFLAALGFPDDPRVPATEQFKSFMAPIIAQARMSLAGGANISDADMRAATSAAAGNIKLERTSIQGVLDAIERINTVNAVEHQKKLLAFTGADPDRQRMVFGTFGVPMEQVVPQGAVDRLRQYADNPTVLKEFDDTFHTPGLAQRILKYRR